MDMVEVDPKLFITCRLCLEEMGQYQIVPKVKIQIKYCFDIEVDPFDGLPQLICRKCESILSEYVVIKQKYQEKQATLKSKTQLSEVELKNEDKLDINGDNMNDEVLPQEAVSSTSNQQTEDDDSKSIEPNEERSTDEDVHDKNIVSDVEEREEGPKKIVLKFKTWRTNFKKYFVCRFCSKKHLEKKAIIKHIRKHKRLLSCIDKNISKHCSVQLEKIDHKENFTSSKKMVVLSKNDIFQNKNANYYVMYSSIDHPIVRERSDSSSSSGIEVQSHQKRKRMRINSRSSSDTVKIDENNETRYETNDLIELSDTETQDSISVADDEETRMMTTESASQSKREKMDVNTIVKSIIEMCHKRYLSKLENLEETSKTKMNSKESQLQHKFLSIGRKLLNTKEFNSLGLLRYLEHKNLDIVYIPKIVNKHSIRDTKHVRIKTRLKEKKEGIIKNSGWLNISYVMDDLNSNPEFSDILKTILVYEPVCREQNDVSMSLPLKDDEAVITRTVDSELDKQQKLLNANPVTNPKQLPKKINHETKPAEVEDKMVMPIITSTVSLSQEVNEKPSTSHRIKVKPDSMLLADPSKKPFCPRVPDVPGDQGPANNWNPYPFQNTTNLNIHTPSPSNPSVLEYTTMSTKPPQKVQVMNSIPNPLVPSLPAQQIQYSQRPVVIPKQLQPVQVFSGNSKQYPQIAPKAVPPPTTAQTANENMNPVNPAQSGEKGFITLHTTQFPNTKTRSPIDYLSQLLRLHKISLLQTSDRPTHVNLMIRFKLLFQQESCTPLTLCVALYGDMNSFFFEVTDSDSKTVEISKLPAHWQWEVLTLFSGESVVNKLLSNAQKIGPPMYERSRLFVNLLKSIKLGVQ